MEKPRAAVQQKKSTLEHMCDEQYDELLMDGTALFYEADITADRVTSVKKSSTTTENADKDAEAFSRVIYTAAREYVHPNSRKEFLEILDNDNLIRCYNDGEHSLAFTFSSKEMTGDYRWFEKKVQLVRNDIDGHIMALFFVRDINEYKMRELEMQRQAERDSLTQLYNRGAMEHIIKDFLLECERTVERQAALIVIDLDNFKLVNDTYGHHKGDEVLCQVAEVLRQLFPQEKIARFGGDEFMVFLQQDVISAAKLHEKMTAVCEQLYAAFDDLSEHFHLSASVGGSIYPQHGLTYTVLYEHADEAQYQAKKMGKNACFVYGAYHKSMQAAKLVEPEWLLDEISDAVYVGDLVSDEILYVNRTMSRWFGMDRHQLENKRCFEMFYGRDRVCTSCFKNELRQKGDFSKECDILIQGKLRHVLMKGRRVQWDRREAMMAIIIDTACSMMQYIAK